MEIKKIFAVIMAVYNICQANAESIASNGGKHTGNKVNPTIVFPQDDINTRESKPNFNLVPSNIQSLKTNSGDLLKNETAAGFQHTFNAKLYEILSLSAYSQNLVFSPISLETLLAFIFTMSGGKLFEELSQLLQLPHNQAYVAKHFKEILQTASTKGPPTSLIMANKLYYDHHYGPLEAKVHFLANNSFASELEEMDFTTSKRSADIINAWISDKTRHLIQNIVTPSSITADTKALLVNSIYFKSDWLIKFDIGDTEVQPFHVSRKQQVPVHMMYNEDVFRYGDFTKDLQAIAVELPYNATNLTMLLILPKDVEGLAELERKLRFYDLQTLTNKLKREIVTVKLPKFNIEYETDMIETLQKMGLNALFNREGFINLFKNQQEPLRVDQFKHKAFMNVNEAGTEAAAVSVAKYVPLSIPVNMKYFIADHPFVFIVRDGDTILFMGHVMQF